MRTEGCTSTTSCDSGESAAASTSQPAQRHAASEHNYELFSIMIHSGSASGGHYYAYIKDFLSQQWSVVFPHELESDACQLLSSTFQWKARPLSRAELRETASN